MGVMKDFDFQMNNIGHAQHHFLNFNYFLTHTTLRKSRLTWLWTFYPLRFLLFLLYFLLFFLESHLRYCCTFSLLFPYDVPYCYSYKGRGDDVQLAGARTLSPVHLFRCLILIYYKEYDGRKLCFCVCPNALVEYQDHSLAHH